jgi:hypothetical protein
MLVGVFVKGINKNRGIPFRPEGRFISSDAGIIGYSFDLQTGMHTKGVGNGID